mmetsp:Transcript_31278/g.50448  ORF Transcript_31278/g.50448 Transcript_31278/m.50448 type:complete len:224 (-) Transcript_31278:1105-1776(-)
MKSLNRTHCSLLGHHPADKASQMTPIIALIEMLSMIFPLRHLCWFQPNIWYEIQLQWCLPRGANPLHSLYHIVKLRRGHILRLAPQNCLPVSPLQFSIGALRIHAKYRVCLQHRWLQRHQLRGGTSSSAFGALRATTLAALRGRKISGKMLEANSSHFAATQAASKTTASGCSCDSYTAEAAQECGSRHCASHSPSSTTRNFHCPTQSQRAGCLVLKPSIALG